MGLFITNSQSGIPARRQVTADGKFGVQGKGGQENKCTTVGLKVSLVKTEQVSPNRVFEVLGW